MSMTSRISGTRRLERRAELRMMDTPGRIPTEGLRSLAVILFITRFRRGFQGILGSSAGIGGEFPALSDADRGVYPVEAQSVGVASRAEPYRWDC